MSLRHMFSIGVEPYMHTSPHVTPNIGVPFSNMIRPAPLTSLRACPISQEKWANWKDKKNPQLRVLDLPVYSM